MAQGWTIVAQRQTTDLGPAGNFVPVMEVTFVTDEQVTGQERIPLNLYTAEYVADVISARVAAIKAVHNL